MDDFEKLNKELKNKEQQILELKSENAKKTTELSQKDLDHQKI